MRTAENTISPPKLMQEDLTDLGSRSLQQRLQEILNAMQEGEALSFSKGIDGSGAGKAPPAAEWGRCIEQRRPPGGTKDEVRPPTLVLELECLPSSKRNLTTLIPTICRFPARYFYV